MYKKNLVFAAACMGMLLFGITLLTLGAVKPHLEIKFQLDEISAATLFVTLTIGILAGSLIFGPVADRYGYKWLLVLACAGTSLGLFGIAYVSSIGVLKFCILFFGICGGVINGAVNAVVADISKDAKGANLSLLGVFFGLGALGMPFVLASLRHKFSFDQIVASAGILAFAVTLLYAFIQFPPSKKKQGFQQTKKKLFFGETLIMLIAFFLFCQSSFEALINNWTTTYLNTQLAVDEKNALYGLTLYVAGMTGMRLLNGSAFRRVPLSKMLWISLGIIFTGILLLRFGNGFPYAVAGLILLGAGLAGGFPIMLGITGEQYPERSGSAFSFVLVIALAGNMLINYLMGIVAENYGIHHMITFIAVELVVMIVLGILIFSKVRKNSK